MYGKNAAVTHLQRDGVDVATLTENKGDKKKNKIRLRRKVRQYIEKYKEKEEVEHEKQLTRGQRNFRLTHRQRCKRLFWKKIKYYK